MSGEKKNPKIDECLFGRVMKNSVPYFMTILYNTVNSICFSEKIDTSIWRWPDVKNVSMKEVSEVIWKQITCKWRDVTQQT